MKRILAALTVIAMTAPAAHADPNQDKWRHAFAASVMVSMVGVTMLYWGNERIDSMEHALCTGDYATDCGHKPPTTQAQVDDFNDKGNRGQTIGRAGIAVLGVGVAASVVTGIMGFRHPHQREVVVAPTVTPTSAGAALTFSF